MAQDFLSLLTSDSRFVRQGSSLQAVCNQLLNIFSSEEILSDIRSNIKSLKNAVRFLNLIQYANKNKDSAVLKSYTLGQVKGILKTGNIEGYSEELLDVDLEQFLKSDYIDYKNVSVEDAKISGHSSLFLTEDLFQLSSSSVKKQNLVTDQESNEFDEDFWVRSVQLDLPFPPQPNGLKSEVEFTSHNTAYCLYGEGVLPWNQSQISAVSDVNRFSDLDILNLFPPIRLYTRSQFMYKKYEGLDYDEDLGVILKIRGFNKRQIRKNIIEYPHLEYLDRLVKRRGEEITLPFWKHIEIEGEIYSTASVWDELDDTKKLPKTESFMNEYVTRRYILECEKGIEHNYPMRGTLEPFVTLYAPPSYYEAHKYDPIEIGRKCVQSRISFKRSRNPVLKMLHDEELSVQ